MRNRVFFPQASLDQWGLEGKIEVTPSELLLLEVGRRYEIVEVVHVVTEVTGTPDPHGLLGKVKSKADLEQMGAEIFEGSMLIGDNAYDVIPGWAGLPIASFPEYLASPERVTARRGQPEASGAPKDDEQLLALLAQGMP